MSRNEKAHRGNNAVGRHTMHTGQGSLPIPPRKAEALLRFNRASGTVVELLPHESGGICVRYLRRTSKGELKPMAFVVLELRELLPIQVAISKHVAKGGRR